jgi:hypothetical protein
MNFLRLISEYEQRKQHIMASVGEYWLDRLVAQQQASLKQRVALTGKVLAVLQDPKLGREIVIPGLNIVTNDGDVYYAQSSVAETPTDDFDAAGAGFRLGTNGTAPTKTSTDVGTEDSAGRKATDGTYPQTNDSDGDNTGAGVDIVTWRVSYTTAEANITGIQEGAIVDDRTTPTAALTHFLFAASFNKTASDTLKVFVNHEMLGV